jgi:hypothetical protein
MVEPKRYDPKTEVGQPFFYLQNGMVLVSINKGVKLHRDLPYFFQFTVAAGTEEVDFGALNIEFEEIDMIHRREAAKLGERHHRNGSFPSVFICRYRSMNACASFGEHVDCDVLVLPAYCGIQKAERRMQIDLVAEFNQRFGGNHPATESFNDPVCKLSLIGPEV